LGRVEEKRSKVFMDKIALIYKVLTGEASENEKKELHDWLDQGENNRNEFEDVKLLWGNANNSDQFLPHASFHEGLNKIKALVKAKIRRRRQLKMTAALIMVSVLVIACFFFYDTKAPEPQRYLRFNNTALSQVINALEDEYNVHIEMEKEELSTCRFTGTFYRTRDVDPILRTLDEALNLNHEIVGERRYRVTGTGCINTP
jgi:ferric-dicitrate binding protein FerR (iron transport regulator)